MPDPTIHQSDLIVIGAGLAGTAAACFAVTRGLKTTQISATSGELIFASGLLDLLDIYPPHEQTHWDNPWEGLAALINDAPRHPYAKVGPEAIREAIREFVAHLEAAGLSYRGLPDHNVTLATAAGTLKTTYRVPRSMWHGVTALREKLPTLLVDFEGMKDFSAKLMVETLRSRWPSLRAERLPFPLTFLGVDRQNPALAEGMEAAEVREKLADLIRPHLADAGMVGMPAILGLRSPDRVVADLEHRLGVGIFEIPTLPPSVPGIRLREALDAALVGQGAQLLSGRQVIGVQVDGPCCTGITIGTPSRRETLAAEGVVLATGRFLGGGLTTDRNRIRETIFGLPVAQPPSRSEWHCDQFLDHRGHPANQAGLEVDQHFRPLGENGDVAFENVFVAGSVLGHQDWIRTKSGAGLAIATAYGAVEAFLRSRRG